MKKYILFFAILFATQAYGQFGGWNYFFSKGGNRINQANTLDTLVLNNLKMPAGTAGHVLTINSVGNVATQAVGAASIGANSIDSTHVKTSGLTADDIRPNAIGASEIDETANVDWTGTHTFDDFIKKADMLDFLGGALKGATDTTAYGVASKRFATNDSAFFDFAVSKRFTTLDSIVIFATTVLTTGDSVAFSLRVKKIAIDASVSAAFNAATIDTVDMGAGVVLKRFVYTSFGSLGAGVGEIVGYIKKTTCTNNMPQAIIRRVLFYGVGLR